MTTRPSPELDAFEERLLDDLKAVVRAQAAPASQASPGRVRPGQVRSRRRRPWYLPLAGAAAATVLIALVASGSRPTPAYAVTVGNGQEVTVTVNRLEGAQALQAALRTRGITADITYLPEDQACQPGRFVDMSTRGLSLSVGADRFTVTIPPGAVGRGQTFVLSAAVAPIDEGVRAIVHFGVAQGVVAPCVMVDAS